MKKQYEYQMGEAIVFCEPTFGRVEKLAVKTDFLASLSSKFNKLSTDFVTIKKIMTVINTLCIFSSLLSLALTLWSLLI